MLTNYNPCVLIQNPYQNAGATTMDSPLNNLPYNDVQEAPVRAEEFNAKIGSSKDMAQRICGAVENESEEDEPMFGTHLREAATTVRKLFGR